MQTNTSPADASVLESGAKGRTNWRVLDLLLTALLLILAAHSFYGLLYSDRAGWDFRVYYYAALAYRNGLNPYSLEVLISLSRGSAVLPYTYPPHTLPLFSALTLLPPQLSWIIFCFGKLAVLGALWFIIKQRIAPTAPAWICLVFTMCFYQSALYIDFAAGNVAILEAVFLFTALFCFLRHRLFLFAVMIAIAASTKIMPLLLLGLLFVEPASRRIAPLITGLCLCGAIFAGNYYWQPEQFSIWLHNASNMGFETGFSNPCFAALFRELGSIKPLVWIPKFSTLIYGVWCLFIIAITWIQARRLDVTNKDSRRLYLVLFCLAFALCAPRFKCYFYIFLLPSAGWVLHELWHRGQHRIVLWVLVIGCLPAFSVTAADTDVGAAMWEFIRPTYSIFSRTIAFYLSAWITLFLWLKVLSLVNDLHPTNNRIARRVFQVE